MSLATGFVPPCIPTRAYEVPAGPDWVMTGTDGYVSVITAFGGNQIIIAYAVNGQPLGCEGPAQTVAPGDKAGGRFVHNIATITVKDASN
jgi:hypothetical protein